MISRKIYFWWSDFLKKYEPSGMIPGENHRYTPKQGPGVMEIAAWLSDDIQHSANSARSWINDLPKLSVSAAPDGFFGFGNAHLIMVLGEHVFLGCEFVEKYRVLMSLGQALDVLTRYEKFLKSGHGSLHKPPAPMDVEFIAEGQEAVALYDALGGKYKASILLSD